MFPYENLEVYKKATDFNKQIYQLLKTTKTIPAYYKDQLGRASLSIMLNMAEGSGRFSHKDRRNFFIMSRSSAFECASLIDFLFAEGDISMKDNEGLKASLEEISKILYVMIKNLEKNIKK